jgi:hypothetical protein
MSYGKAYTITAAAKTEPTETTYTCEIWQKGFSGSVQTLDPAFQPFTAQILASSDDPFDPILASTFRIVVDVTDFTGTLPDFTGTDDRQFWVKLYNGSYYVWQGFVINDTISIPFVSGRTFLSIPCTDGLAMLKNIPYVPSNADINVAEDLSTTITNCLNKIVLPDGYYVNYCCGIYATGLSTSASVFKQTYYPTRNWMKESPRPSQTGTPISPFLNCYDVLSNIVFSFGCQLFQSYGQWWIANVNERGEDSIRSFQTTEANGSESVTVRFTERDIVPFADTTSTPWFFQDASQIKILRKGYQSFELKCPTVYAPNMTDNGAMIDIDSSFPRNWVKSLTGVTLSSLGNYNAILLAPTDPSGPLRQVQCTALSNAPAYIGDKLNLSFLIDGQYTISATPKVQLQIFIVTPSVVFWYMDKDGNWSTTSGLIDVIGNTTATYEQISYSSKVFPVSGKLTITYLCDYYNTQTCVIANQQVTYSSPYDYRLVSNSVTDVSYKKQVEFYLGGPCDQFNTSQRGSLLDSSGATLQAWHRYNISESFDDLTKLIAQQYYNIQSNAVINVDGTLKNLLDTRSTVLSPKKIPHVIGSLDNVKFQDTTGVVSISGKYYIAGATNLNYTEDTVSGTFLEVSDTDITVSFSDKTILKA